MRHGRKKCRSTSCVIKDKQRFFSFASLINLVVFMFLTIAQSNMCFFSYIKSNLVETVQELKKPKQTCLISIDPFDKLEKISLAASWGVTVVEYQTKIHLKSIKLILFLNKGVNNLFYGLLLFLLKIMNHGGVQKLRPSGRTPALIGCLQSYLSYRRTLTTFSSDQQKAPVTRKRRGKKRHSGCSRF